MDDALAQRALPITTPRRSAVTSPGHRRHAGGADPDVEEVAAPPLRTAAVTDAVDWTTAVGVADAVAAGTRRG